MTEGDIRRMVAESVRNVLLEYGNTEKGARGLIALRGAKSEISTNPLSTEDERWDADRSIEDIDARLLANRAKDRNLPVFDDQAQEYGAERQRKRDKWKNRFRRVSNFFFGHPDRRREQNITEPD